MKIDAYIEVSCPRQNLLFRNVTVPVDMDYVTADYNDVLEYIANSKEIEALRKSSSLEPADMTISVLNMDDILEDISFDEYCNAVNDGHPKWM